MFEASIYVTTIFFFKFSHRESNNEHIRKNYLHFKTTKRANVSTKMLKGIKDTIATRVKLLNNKTNINSYILCESLKYVLFLRDISSNHSENGWSTSSGVMKTSWLIKVNFFELRFFALAFWQTKLLEIVVTRKHSMTVSIFYLLIRNACLESLW